jgi:hypothetical protein
MNNVTPPPRSGTDDDDATGHNRILRHTKVSDVELVDAILTLHQRRNA